tara:strand:+ start:599 stop:1123 length:525 start_codon:yes stop_codon:yes gene_type:complete
MKYFVKFFVITFFLIIANFSHATQSVKFIDMNMLMNKSKAGAEAQKILLNMQKKDIESFKKIENELKEEESKLVSQKKVLSKEEYEKLSKKLRKKAINYQKNRREKLEKIQKLRSDARIKLLKNIQPLLENYASENGVNIILDKKDLVLGKNQHDITKEIIKLLNEKLTTLNLQ